MIVYDIIWIFVLRVNKFYSYLLFVMSKRTKISILALICIFCECLTIFALITARMVKLFNFIVSLFAVTIQLETWYMAVFFEIRPTTVFVVVVVKTNFSLMGFFVIRILHFQGQGLVLNVFMSNLKNCPSLKYLSSIWWR